MPSFTAIGQHIWIIDDLAHFRRPILEGGALSPNISQGWVDQLYQTP